MPAPTVKRGQIGSASTQTLLAAMYADLVGQDALTKTTTYTVAQLPTASANAGRFAYCSNGAAGQPAIVFCNGTNWKVVAALGANASAS